MRLMGGNRRRLGLSPQHVKNQVSIILSKLEAASRTEAAVIALRSGLVQIQDSTLAV